MCGISAFFARESVPDLKVINDLFQGMLNRGNDGFGLCWIHNKDNKRRQIEYAFKDIENCNSEQSQLFIKEVLYPNLKIGDVLIAIQRAAPETENASDPEKINETLQPIVSKEHRLCVVHNGAVSKKIENELKEWAKETNEYKFESYLDSEAILAAYIKHQRNMKNTMEYLSGGYALIMYDEAKDSLIIANDHMQIAHSYIRGIGFFLHSDNDVLGEIIQNITGMNRDGIFIWESHYHHYLDGHAIREIDLQSGFMRKIKYNTRYIVGDMFDSSKKL